MPFFAGKSGFLSAQIETGMHDWKCAANSVPRGFFPPFLGWSPILERPILKAGFNYALVDSHCAFLAEPPAERGVFYPMSTPEGLYILSRDVPAGNYIMGQRAAGRPEIAAASFLAFENKRLTEAASLIGLPALSLCVIDTSWPMEIRPDLPAFIESLFRAAACGGAETPEIRTISEYLDDRAPATFQTLLPGYGSAGTGGYGEEFLPADNIGLCRHIICSVGRMEELARRFEGGGVCERALRQAAREILLATSADWFLRRGAAAFIPDGLRETEYRLRGFSTIYEALGGGHISTKWLRKMEEAGSIFQDISYRAFRGAS
jgi:predicted glycosyl hydrolase (DUF1957 family)